MKQVTKLTYLNPSLAYISSFSAVFAISCLLLQKKVFCKSKHRWLCAQTIYKLKQTKLSQYVYFSLVLREQEETKAKYSAPKIDARLPLS